MIDDQTITVDDQKQQLADAAAKQKQKEAYNELFDYETAKKHIKSLISDFEGEKNLTRDNRDRRLVDVDVKALRTRGDLKQDETMIPIRVIDQNISREKPSYVAYLQQSRRLVIFVDKLNPKVKHDELEAAFTRGMTYQGWLTPHYKVVDGAQCHGWDWAEIVYDDSKPLHAGIEHVGHDRLIYNTQYTEDIQNCGRVLREFRLTKAQLEEFTEDYGFDAEQVGLLISSGKDSTKEGAEKDKTYIVYKKFCKYREPGSKKAVVWVSWYADSGCTNWLKKPMKLYLGVRVEQMVDVQQEIPMEQFAMMASTGQIPTNVDAVINDETQSVLVTTQQKQWVDVDEVEYPFTLFIYDETEEKTINKHYGRVFKDKHKQEAMTAGWSSFMNGHFRASGVYASPDGQPQTTSGLETMEIKHGRITKLPVKFWSPPYPDAAMLEALQALDIKNANDANQITYAIQNKQNSRTTATEVNSGKEDQALLTGVQVTLFSSYVRDTYTKVWRIVQSQALQGKIALYGTYTETIGADGEPTVNFTNDIGVIKKDYDIRPAGDEDYIRRIEKINLMMKFWPVVANTPIAGAFLGEMLKLQFAEDGEAWARQLEAGDPRMLLAQFVDIVSKALANPAELAQIGPMEKQNLMQLIQAAQQVIGAAQNGQPGNTSMVPTPADTKTLSGATGGNEEVGQPGEGAISDNSQ